MEQNDHGPQLTGHVVICNVNPKVGTIVAELHREEPRLPVAIVVQDRSLWAMNQDWHPTASDPGAVTVVEGCPTDPEVLAEACISKARAAIVLADPRHGDQADARSALVAVAIERANPQVHTVIELLLSVNLGHLRATEVNEVICLGEIAEKLVSQSCITPGTSRLFSHLLTTRRDTSQIFIEPVPEPLVGRSYRSIALEAVKACIPSVVCGYILGASLPRTRRRIVLNPRPRAEPGRDTVLGTGDRLIVMAVNPGTLLALQAPADPGG